MGYHLKPFVDDNAASVLPRRPAITDVGGDSAILSARQLFESCRDNHQLCPGRTTPLLPTRVIDVGTDGENGKVKLYIASPAELGDYAALSYCWGGPQPVLLTTKNSSQMLEDIPYDSLPETIKDAIIVTRGLELRFLWIDALCIIQEGDETDKIREIGCMGQLYKNATVTIFAASAKSVSEGFLHSRFKPASFSLPITCPDGSQGTAQLMLGDTHSSMYPLNTRGWTLQETLLSSRKLVYGEKEQIWDCATEQKRELPSSFYDPEWSFQQLPQEIFVPGGLISAASQQEIWGSVLYEFTGRCLSFPEDRYAAVTGVISELETAFQDDCSFGLWRGNFMRQLAWARTGTTREEADGLLCGAPAWSWASRQFQISFLSFEPDDANCWELRDNSVVLNRKLIKGHDISVIHRAGCTKYLDWASPIGPFYDTFLLEHEGKDVFYLLLGQFRNETVCESTMVLVSTEHEGEFRRLGLVYNGSGTNWFDHLENQEVILI
jgi:hypothetical protein